MRDFIEREFTARVLAWAEPCEDHEEYRVLTRFGDLLIADSIVLLITALGEREGERLPLAA